MVITSLTALVLSTVLAGTASAAFPGRNGKLAYELGGHIWTVNPDGTAARRLTSAGINRNPQWSADGSRIAFTRSRNIFVMNADGSGKRQVTSTGRDLQPAWSPDGRQLVFIRLQANGRGDLYRMPAAGGTARRMTWDAASTGGNDRPTWSPKGGLVLYLHYGATGAAVIRTVDVATGRQRVVPAGVPLSVQDGWGPDTVDRPEWAPDGAHIMFMARCASADDCAPAAVNVMRSDLRTTTRSQLTGYFGLEGEWDTLDSFAVAPDGTSLAEVGCHRYQPETGVFAFCGLRPGDVENATNPNWQPRR